MAKVCCTAVRVVHVALALLSLSIAAIAFKMHHNPTALTCRQVERSYSW